MAFFQTHQFFQLLILASLVHFTMAAREVPKSSSSSSSQVDPNMVFKYHNGRLLRGNTAVNVIWYGQFSASERAIVADFITSLSSTNPTTATNQPSVATWWKLIDEYLQIANSNKKSSAKLTVSLGTQILDESYSLGRHLTSDQIKQLAAKGQQKNAINIVLTAADVTADGFCSSTCGTHGWLSGSTPSKSNGKKITKSPYIWVGNSATQCPGQCAWPFQKPTYGPQSPPLIAPNDNVGMDGMIINTAALLADTVTNPYGTGFFQGPASAPLEAASACQGLYGDGSYPGYAGTLLEDKTTGASFNAYGINGRKYLLPALFDPSTSACSTLV